MDIKGFLWQERYLIVYGVSIIVFILAQGKQWIKTQAYSAMLIAKRKAKDGILTSGKEQEDWVVTQLHILLIRLKIPFVTEDMLRPMVKKLYEVTKDYLDDGQINGSITNK